MATIEDGGRRATRFDADTFAKPESGESVVVIDRTGAEIDVESANEGGVILRGDDADNYLAGEPVAVAGVGWVTADGGFSHSKPEDEAAREARERADNELPETPEPKAPKAAPKQDAKPDDK
jgi:hypothetical protein